MAAQRGVTLRDVIEEALRRQLQPHVQREAASKRGRLRSKGGFLVLQHKGGRVINPTPAQLDESL